MSKFAAELYEILRDEFGDAWDEASTEQKAMLGRLAAHAATVGIRALASGPDAVSQDVARLKATAANLGWIAEDKALEAIRNAAVRGAGSLIGSALSFI